MVEGGGIRTDVERFGWPVSLFARLMRLLQKRLGVHVCRVRIRPLIADRPAAQLPPQIRIDRLDRETLLEACEDPEMSLSREFVETALERGDVSFGVFDGDRLVSYM